MSSLLAPAKALALLSRFCAAEAAGGIVLMVAAASALFIANSPLAAGYFASLHGQVGGLSLGHWINDGLMALFFLLVGLEIKHELAVGQLACWHDRALPGLAALGGMAVPALLYALVNRHDHQTLAGWAIPAATDIAFALGVLALLGSRVPASLKVFLSALAILDDLGAVLIIALFYTRDLSTTMLLAAAGLVALLFLLNRLKVRALLPYLLLGALLWFCLLRSGLHATLAGVILALFIPLGDTEGDEASPLLRLESALHPWVAFLVVPLFGFANAGVSLAGLAPSNLLDPVPLGVALGLFLGKQLGITLLVLLAIRSGLARRPAGASWLQLYGVALLCGIGFTMSLFIGALAFPGMPALVDEVKIGVLLGSLLSALAGSVVLVIAARRR